MFNGRDSSASYAYEPDTTVIDAEDMTMQVQIGGVWHKRFLSRFVTACGIPYHSQFTVPRHNSIEGPLCRDCFTIYELAESEKLKAQTDKDVL